MIELKSAVISSNDESSNIKLDVRYDKGLNVIDYKQKFLFDFFFLKNQSLDEGELLINDKRFLPTVGSNSHLAVLQVNSKVFVLAACFIIEENNKTSMNQLQDKLAALRDMPLLNDKEKTNKIKAMLKTITASNPAYISFDKNNQINNEHAPLINKAIAEVSGQAVFLILDTSPTEQALPTSPSLTRLHEIPIFENDHVCYINISSGEIINVQEPTILTRQETTKLAIEVLKVNYVSYLISLVSTSFSVLFIAVLHHYLLANDIFMSVFLICVCLVFIAISYLLVLSSFDFMSVSKKNSKARRRLSQVYAEIVALVSVLSAVGIFYLMGSNNYVLELAEYQATDFIPAIIIAVIHLLIPVFIIPLRKLTIRLKSIFGKKKK